MLAEGQLAAGHVRHDLVEARGDHLPPTLLVEQALLDPAGRVAQGERDAIGVEPVGEHGHDVDLAASPERIGAGPEFLEGRAEGAGRVAVERGPADQEAAQLGNLAERLGVAAGLEPDLSRGVGSLQIAPPGVGVLHRLEDLVGGVGLGDVVVGPDAEALEPVLGGDAGGDHDDGDQAGRLPYLEGLADLVAVDVGEHQVEEDDVGVFAGGLFRAPRRR